MSTFTDGPAPSVSPVPDVPDEPVGPVSAQHPAPQPSAPHQQAPSPVAPQQPVPSVEDSGPGWVQAEIQRRMSGAVPGGRHARRAAEIRGPGDGGPPGQRPAAPAQSGQPAPKPLPRTDWLPDPYHAQGLRPPPEPAPGCPQWRPESPAVPARHAGPAQGPLMADDPAVNHGVDLVADYGEPDGDEVRDGDSLVLWSASALPTAPPKPAPPSPAPPKPAPPTLPPQTLLYGVRPAAPSPADLTRRPGPQPPPGPGPGAATPPVLGADPARPVPVEGRPVPVVDPSEQTGPTLRTPVHGGSLLSAARSMAADRAAQAARTGPTPTQPVPVTRVVPAGLPDDDPAERPRSALAATDVPDSAPADGSTTATAAGTVATEDVPGVETTMPVPASGQVDPLSGRVRVVLSERRQTPRSVRTVVDVQDLTSVGDLLRSNLIGTQLGVALRVAAVALLALGSLPALFALFPELGRLEVAGLRLPWLLLGVLVYPFLLLLGWWHTRSAEKVEQEFADHVQD